MKEHNTNFNILFFLDKEVSQQLTEGGAGNWIQNNMKIYKSKKISKIPWGVQILLDDQLLQSFSSPGSLDISLSNFGIYDIGTCFNNSKPLDYQATFSFVTIGELARHGKNFFI